MIAAYQQDTGTDTVLVSVEMTLTELESRLERGLALIEERQAAGLSVARLEEHWITLLQTYESLFDGQQ